MTVKELVEALDECDPDATVETFDPEREGWCDAEEVDIFTKDGRDVVRIY